MNPETPTSRETSPPKDSEDAESSRAAAVEEDFLSRLARRSSTPPEVTPRLGLRFAPTPDLPDEDTARWHSEWHRECHREWHSERHRERHRERHSGRESESREGDR